MSTIFTEQPWIAHTGPDSTGSVGSADLATNSRRSALKVLLERGERVLSC